MIEPKTSDKEVFRALGDFLTFLFPEMEIFKGQINRVPMPMNGFICINNSGKRFMSMNRTSYENTETKQVQFSEVSTDYLIQADFYGPSSGNQSQAFVTIFKDGYGFDKFPSNIKPLTTGEPVQIPLQTGEKQYLERWKVNVQLQYNPIVEVPMTFFNEVDIQLISADTIPD